MSLKDVITKFTDSIKDLTNLQVTTYTGTLEQVVNAQTGQIQWEQFKPTGGKLVLVAATMIQPNLNTINYRAAALDQGDLKTLSDLHLAAVDSAQNGRLALVKMVAGLLPAGAI